MSHPHSRRGFLFTAGTALFTIPSKAAAPAKPVVAYQPLNRFPRMVQEFFIAQLRDAEKRGLADKAKLVTKADAEAYVKAGREKVRSCFGSEPERTPLNPRVTGTLDRDGYTVEKVIFDSRPNFPVTANLYLPKRHKPPFPGVIGTCGHATEGKASAAYQAYGQGLALLGYACLIFDPIGQGERCQFLKPDGLPFTTAVAEHVRSGDPQFLVGEFLGAWMTWDGIRAVDYLMTRPEVDRNQIGVTGNSGGGTQAAWLAALDPRITMAAPSCFVTTFRRNLENELPVDTEQCPPGCIGLGLDEDDFLACFAPRPLAILGQEKDFFDARGTEEVYRRLKRLYGLLGKEGEVSLFMGPSNHGFSKHNREAMYRWFDRCTGGPSGREEPVFKPEKDADVWCTPKGQVIREPGVRTVSSLTAEKSKRLAKERGNPKGAALKSKAVDLLKLPKWEGVPDYRIWEYLGSRGYPSKHAIAYAVETEPGIYALVYRLSEEKWHSRPPRTGSKAILYAAHRSADAELRDESLVRELIAAEPEATVFACDVRGVGESQPNNGPPGSFLGSTQGDSLYARNGMMLGRPYLGMRVFDLLRVLDWMADLGHKDVHLVGREWGAIAAAFAALLGETVQRVTLKNTLASYAAIAESTEWSWPLATFLPGVLAKFDLPDIYRELEAKKLRLIDRLGAKREKL